MKSRLLLLASVLFLVSQGIKAQTGEFYTTSGGEMVFSFATIDDNGSSNGNIMRWSPVFNFQNLVNYDAGKAFGLFSGINIRNVGYIYDNYTDPVTGDKVKKKFRNYNIGIPLGIKLGNLDKLFFYGGYEIEFPIAYKEKTFQNEVKNKFVVWFSKRTPTVYHTVLVGIQFPYGFNLKFKYYLTNFHNKDFTESVGGIQTKPYENLNANVFYFSLSFNLFKNTKFYYKEEFKSDTKYGAL